MNRGLGLMVLAGSVLALLTAGCGKSFNTPEENAQTTIRVEGSDTMVNIAQAWAENYHLQHTAVSVQVLGGGSGVGIASLIDGNCDMANSSREMKSKEIDRAVKKRGDQPKEHVVGYDALGVYVHKGNPLDSISLEELAEIYGDGGKTTTWGQLGVKGTLANQKIVRVSRQNSSGTYDYFREAVLGKKRDLKLGSIDQSGSKDVVSLVSRTPSAIGYSGMGYMTDEVKALRISRRKGEESVSPTVENVNNQSYPLNRSLLIYTIGDPTGSVKEYLGWILGSEGQKVVLELGYVPLAEAAETPKAEPKENP